MSFRKFLTATLAAFCFTGLPAAAQGILNSYQTVEIKASIWDVWDAAVGHPVATNAKPYTFKDGTLIVHVSSSSWIHQLKFLEKQLIANINRHMDARVVSQIRFKIGNIHS